jgi:HPt (histidine-containing phosphotransfer) domain-containing protein
MINIERLKEFLGNEELFFKYIELFKSSGPEYLGDIKDALEHRDKDKLKVASHSLKTQLAYLDHQEGEKLAYYLEHLKPEELNSQTEKNKNTYESLKNYLDEIMIELSAISFQ